MNEGGLIIGYIHNGDVKGRFMRSVINFLSYDGANRKLVRNLFESESSDIVQNRNRVVQSFLDKSEAEWLMFIDTDIVFDPETIYQLLDVADPLTAPIVSGLYFGFLTHEYRWPLPFAFDITAEGEYRSIREIGTEPVRIAGAGMGFCLIHRSVFEKVAEAYKEDPWKWFGRDQHMMGGKLTVLGEDFTFFRRAEKVGAPIWLHPGVRVQHLKSRLESFGTFVEGHKLYLEERVSRNGDAESVEVLEARE